MNGMSAAMRVLRVETRTIQGETFLGHSVSPRHSALGTGYFPC